jgi:hypothetical protein
LGRAVRMVFVASGSGWTDPRPETLEDAPEAQTPLTRLLLIADNVFGMGRQGCTFCLLRDSARTDEYVSAFRSFP